MSKPVKILIVIAVIIILLVIAFIALRIYTRNNIMDGDGMINQAAFVKGCEYRYYGDDIGSSEYIVLELGESKALLTVETCKGNGYKTEKKTYRLDSTVINQLQNIYDKYDVPTLKNLPKSDIQALDAGTATIVFITGNETISLSDNLEFPEGKGAVIQETHAYLRSLAQ